jgi:glycosyltransferase involved in cell wall biosynthesis
MKILWLCSWYPHSIGPLDGDFVERHARSLATQTHVDVIHFVQNFNFLKGQRTRSEYRNEPNLSANIYYTSLSNTGIRFIDHMVYNILYYFKFKRVIKDYLNRQGKPDIIHVHVPVKAGIVALWLKKRFGIPFVVTEHATVYFKNSHDNYYERGAYYKYVTKKTFIEADAVVSVSQCLAEILGNLFTPNRTFIIRNSVDTNLFFPVDGNRDRKQFIHVSMMGAFKNVEGILQGFAQLNKTNKNWKAVMVGPVLPQLEQLANELELSNQIIWKGTLTYTEVAKEMQKSDALVHFSHYENLPCVVNEALCCGIPVISSDVGGISEIINETNGLLVEAGKSDALANALIQYLDTSEQYSKRAISMAASVQFNYNAIGKQMVGLYNQVLKKN